MPKFAIYYIPDADSEFYSLGSAILGYDVRQEKLLNIPAKMKSNLGDIDPEWLTSAQKYGFHLTIGDSIDFEIILFSIGISSGTLNVDIRLFMRSPPKMRIKSSSVET